MTQGIYQIRNVASGRVYVGSASIIERRWKRHLKDLRAGKHHAQYLQRSWAKHGAAAFVFEVVEVVAETASLIEAEQRWIDKLGAYGPRGYNSHAKAASPIGFRHTPEARKKISEAGKRRVYGPVTPEARLKMSEAQKRRFLNPVPQETRDRIRAKSLGRKHTDESRQKISMARAGKPVSEVQRLSMLGRVRTEEHQRKINAALTGRKQSPDVVEKRAAACRGKKRSLETRERMREAAKARCARGPSPLKGRKRDSETIRKVAEANRGKKRSFEEIERLRIAANERWANGGASSWGRVK